jgi:DNA-directed RNA polymerase subunit RPC12/RpoP
MSIEDYLKKRQNKATHDKILKKNDDKKEEWKSTICPYCAHKVLYRPKEKFSGRLGCPKCRKEFLVP